MIAVAKATVMVGVIVLLALSETAHAFQSTTFSGGSAGFCRTTAHFGPTRNTFLRQTSSSPDVDADETDKGDVVKNFLLEKFPEFSLLVSMNEDEIWSVVRKAISAEEGTGCTIFAPNSQAFKDLGQKKLDQLKDPRNLETAQKMSAYHIIPDEVVTYQQLRTEDWTKPKPKGGGPRPLTIEGVVTQGGEVPVGHSKSGGFFGIGAKEELDAVLGPNAKIVGSFNFGKKCVVHEVDALISPDILWRYCDQLRIPGS